MPRLVRGRCWGMVGLPRWVRVLGSGLGLRLGLGLGFFRCAAPLPAPRAALAAAIFSCFFCFSISALLYLCAFSKVMAKLCRMPG